MVKRFLRFPLNLIPFLKKKIMKTFIFIGPVARLLVCGLLFVAAVGFDRPVGGDSVTIYLNDEKIHQQQYWSDKTVKTLLLDFRKGNDKLRVFFNHCGAIDSQRALLLKDGRGTTLKTWRFADAENWNSSGMEIPVKEISSSSKNDTFELYYTAKEYVGSAFLVKLKLVDSAMSLR